MFLKPAQKSRSHSTKDYAQKNPRDVISWNNKNITVAGKSVCRKDWHSVGIARIKDLLDKNDNFF